MKVIKNIYQHTKTTWNFIKQIAKTTPRSHGIPQKWWVLWGCSWLSQYFFSTTQKKTWNGPCQIAQGPECQAVKKSCPARVALDHTGQAGHKNYLKKRRYYYLPNRNISSKPGLYHKIPSPLETTLRVKQTGQKSGVHFLLHVLG